MGNFIGTLLFVTGYTYDYKENINEAPLSIRVGQNNTYYTKEILKQKKKFIYKIPGHLYNAFIIILMFWRVGYTLSLSIENKSTVSVGRSAFQFLIVVQYILGIIYFRKNHFYKNISTK